MSNKILPSGIEKNYYDCLFKAIFGRNNDQSKKWRLELYNALRGTNYTDPDALEINTIENVIYLTQMRLERKKKTVILNGQQN